MDRTPDWPRIATLRPLVAAAADLEWIDLLQRGLLDAPLRLTAAGTAAFAEQLEMVLRDPQGTPLAVAAREGEVLHTESVRPVEPEPPFIPVSDVLLLVKGPLAPADLARIDAALEPGSSVAWLVCADRSAGGRALVCEARTARLRWPGSSHTLMRLPWPRPGADDLWTSTLPTAHRLAAAYGARHWIELGDDRRSSPGRGGAVVFFTGLSGAGKSTIAELLRDTLDSDDERPVTLLDGDEVRRYLSPDLGFDEAARATHVRRVSWVSSLLAGAGGIAVSALIAPFAHLRREAREMTGRAGADFIEVWIATPLTACEGRDRKGLYAKARSGELPHFTGISSPYEEPTRADVVIDTTVTSPREAVELIVAALNGQQKETP